MDTNLQEPRRNGLPEKLIWLVSDEIVNDKQ